MKRAGRAERSGAHPCGALLRSSDPAGLRLRFRQAPFRGTYGLHGFGLHGFGHLEPCLPPLPGVVDLPASSRAIERRYSAVDYRFSALNAVARIAGLCAGFHGHWSADRSLARRSIASSPGRHSADSRDALREETGKVTGTRTHNATRHIRGRPPSPLLTGPARSRNLELRTQLR